jgi:hypothetical protein
MNSQLIAAQILEDQKFGRIKPILGSQKPVVKVAKKNKKTPSIILFFLVSWAVYSGIQNYFFHKYSVSGYAYNKGNTLASYELAFHSTNSENVITCKSNTDGDFHARLKEDFYRVCVLSPDNISEGYKNPKSTPFRIKVTQDLESIRLYIVK